MIKNDLLGIIMERQFMDEKWKSYCEWLEKREHEITVTLMVRILSLWPYVKKNALNESATLSEFIDSDVSELSNYHFGLELHIRNYYLYPDKEFQELFIENGIRQVDDMSSIMIRIWYKSLRKGILNA
jgi:hypothetical protein